MVMVGRWPGELVPAVGAARADHQAGFAEADHELLEVGTREVLLAGDLGKRRWTLAEVPPELDHQAHAVFALGAEGDGAAAVKREARSGGRRGGQGGVLNPE